MKDFFRYLKYKKNLIVLFFLILLIFALVYFSYDLIMEAFIYACILSMFLVLIYIIHDFYKYNNRKKLIGKYSKNLDGDFLSGINYRDEIEYEYLNIINELNKLINEKDFQTSKKIKEVEDFFIMWTHQIKLPISALNLYIDSNEKIDKNVLKIQIKRIEYYTKMVMAYIRLNSEDSDFLFEEVDLDLMIKNVIKDFKIDFINKKLSLDYEKTSIKLVTDKKWFEFALEQILSNALKYTKKGGISIYIEEDMLVVEDSGIGIKNEDLNRIFEKGYTGYNGRNNSSSSGLGLYLVKKTLSSLNHTIRVESILGKGTKVYIGLKRYNFIGE